jgi:hypothetical protein
MGVDGSISAWIDRRAVQFTARAKNALLAMTVALVKKGAAALWWRNY